MRPEVGHYNTACGTHTMAVMAADNNPHETKTIDTKLDALHTGRHPLETFTQLYHVGEEIGSGKFATVKRCICPASGAEFAAKFIKKSRSARFGQKVEDIELEIDILNDLKHDHIIDLVNIFEDAHQVILVFELMKGGELQDYIAECDRLSEAVAKDFLTQILSALTYMHQKSIVHLDLKPENILLRDLDDNRLKIIDFGISRRFTVKSDIKGIYGTPEFTAPEILNYEPVSYGTDMWAIGCIAYTMLYGVSPFYAETKQDIYANITRASFDFDIEHCDISELAQDFITKLLVKDERKRMSSFHALQHPWLVSVANGFPLIKEEQIEDVEEATFEEIDINAPQQSSAENANTIVVNFQIRARWKHALRLVIWHNRYHRRKNNYKTKTLSPTYYRRVVVSRNSTGTTGTDCSSGCSHSHPSGTGSADLLSSNSLTIDGDFEAEEEEEHSDLVKQDESFLLAALFGAIEEGNLNSIVELFTASHIDPNQCNKHGESLLHYCAGLGQLPIFEYLLSIGADIGVIDDQGDTVVHWAARQNHAHVIRYIYEQTVEIEVINKNLETPLHVAARYGHVEAIEQLCKCGANVNAVDEHGETAILIAVWHGFPKIVHILGEIGADTNLKNKEEETALHVASARGHAECVRCLLDAGADPNLQNKNSYTPLHLALKRQHTAVGLLLLKGGANLEQADHHGERAVHYVARYNLVPICQWLCMCVPPSRPCNVNVANKQGLYPLHIAAKAGHIEIVRTLCLAGSIVDQKDKDLIIPQICAIAQSHNDIADLLTRLRNEQQKEEFIAQLTATTQPLTRVKLKIFGHSGAGKSTLIESMKCGYFSSWFRRSKVLSSNSLTLRTLTPEAGISIISGSNVAPSNGGGKMTVVVGENQTKGIDCQQVYISGVGDLSIWEFSGAPVYYQFYDHFIGNDDIGNCLHAIVFRLSDCFSVQLETITFWLSFLQSRMRVHSPLMYGGKSSEHANIILIATHADLVDGGSGSYYTRSELDGTMKQQLNRLWTQLIARFANVFDIHETIFMMDANVAGSVGMKQLKAHLTTTKQCMVQEMPFTTQFLDCVLTFLNLYRKASLYFPVLTLHQFKEMIRSQINPLASDDHFKQLVQQLEFMGEIVYLRAASVSSLDLIVLNAKWLNSDILAKLLLMLVNCKTATIGAHRPNVSQLHGIYSIDEFQELFPDVDALDLLQLLEAMSLCVPNDRSGDIEYEFPCFNVSGNLETLLDQFHDQDTNVYHGVVYKLEEEENISGGGGLLTSVFVRIQVALRSELRKHTSLDVDDLHNCLKFSYFHASQAGLWAILSIDSQRERLEARFAGPEDGRREAFFFMHEILMIVERTLAMCLPGVLIEKWFYSPAQLHTQREYVSHYTSAQLMRTMLTVSASCNSSAVLRRKVTSHDGKIDEMIGDILFFGITDLSEINLAEANGAARASAQANGKLSTRSSPTNGSAFITSGLNDTSNIEPLAAHPPTLVNQLHSSNLPLLTKQKLCALLDPPEAIGRDWCMLGILLGMTDKLPKLDPANHLLSHRTTMEVSPTARVLEECARNVNCTIKVLVDKLSELNRFDAVEVILRTCPLLRISPLSSLPEEGVVYNDESSHTSLGVSTLSHTSSSNLSR